MKLYKKLRVSVLVRKPKFFFSLSLVTAACVSVTVHLLVGVRSICAVPLVDLSRMKYF